MVTYLEGYLYKNIDPVFRVTSLINVAYYNFSENFEFAGESHDFWELSYIERGQMVIEQDEKRYLLKSGELIFCKPNVFHKCWVWEGKNASVLTLAFEVKGVDMKIFEKNIAILNSDERQCVSAIMREAKNTYANFYAQSTSAVSIDKLNNTPYGSEQIICNRLEELMISAFRGRRNILAESRIIASVPCQTQTKLSHRIIEYMKEHISEKITLNDLAKSNYISVSTLKRVFAQQVGCSIISYLTDLRIENAKDLLRRQEYSISAVAEKTGFASVHYFSSVFKNHTGMTPRQYIEQEKIYE